MNFGNTVASACSLSRATTKKQAFASVRGPCNRVRQIVDGVNSQLVAEFSKETNHAPIFQRVVCAAFHYVYCSYHVHIFVKRLLVVLDYLQIEKLTFPKLHEPLRATQIG